MKTNKKPATKSTLQHDVNCRIEKWLNEIDKRLDKLESSVKQDSVQVKTDWWAPLGFPREPQENDIVQCCNDEFLTHPILGYFQKRRDNGQFDILHIVGMDSRECVWRKIRPIPNQQTWWLKAGFSVKPSPSTTVLFLSLPKVPHECWNIGKYIGSYDNERGHIVEYLGKRETCSSIKPYTPISTRGQ